MMMTLTEFVERWRQDERTRRTLAEFRWSAASENEIGQFAKGWKERAISNSAGWPMEMGYHNWLAEFDAFLGSMVFDRSVAEFTPDEVETIREAVSDRLDRVCRLTVDGTLDPEVGKAASARIRKILWRL